MTLRNYAGHAFSLPRRRRTGRGTQRPSQRPQRRCHSVQASPHNATIAPLAAFAAYLFIFYHYSHRHCRGLC